MDGHVSEVSTKYDLLSLLRSRNKKVWAGAFPFKSVPNELKTPEALKFIHGYFIRLGVEKLNTMDYWKTIVFSYSYGEKTVFWMVFKDIHDHLPEGWDSEIVLPSGFGTSAPILPENPENVVFWVTVNRSGKILSGLPEKRIGGSGIILRVDTKDVAIFLFKGKIYSKKEMFKFIRSGFGGLLDDDATLTIDTLKNSFLYSLESAECGVCGG